MQSRESDAVFPAALVAVAATFSFTFLPMLRLVGEL